jgi:acylphosphatase
VPGAKHYLVRGRVQGVGYRYFALEAAERLGIRGYARNLPGGEVEIHAEGESKALQSFEEELRGGPALARVRDVIGSDSPVTQGFTSFLIRG